MHERAGLPAEARDLIDVDDVTERYYTVAPDPHDPSQQVSFGTSGHRGKSTAGSFNEAHILAITQAIVDYRLAAGITGPVFVGADTHLLSGPAHRTVIDVLAGNGIEAYVDQMGRPTPTPAVSHAIIGHNRHHGSDNVADGIIITPSHNPPSDGGIKYNPPHGGPADDTITRHIADVANDYLTRLADIPRAEATATGFDYVGHYVADLDRVVNMAAIADSHQSFAVHPLGGASVDYWKAIADTWNIGLHLVDDTIDPQFGFMTLDHDGAIRMDPSSPHVMAVTDSVTESVVLVANDADADRHGIRSGSQVMNPNHFLAVAIDYLLTNRPEWKTSAGVGKTMVSSSMIDTVVAHHGRPLHEVPVGFKWFVPGLADTSLCFGGEESAGAVPVAKDGSTWVTEKDGIVMGLLAMEIAATTGITPADYYRQLEARHGATHYRRHDFPATAAVSSFLKRVNPEDLAGSSLAGDPIRDAATSAPTGGKLGGIKLVTDSGWIAARPSGTEPIYKIYAESFVSAEHVEALAESARVLLEQGAK